jgi:putative Holliday junction resolvase
MTDSGTNPESRTPNPDLSLVAILACVRALGIDYGRRRIGLALSDATGMLARPWKTIAGGGGATRVATLLAAEIALLTSESDGLSAVAFGYPRRLNGEATEQTVAVEQIVARLRTVVQLPIVLQDERLSSREAESLLARREKDWRKRKALLDAASAAIILQDYLDGQARARPDESGLEEDEQ